jgi:pimeloyl-ACP methyl ester carboxylesterase
MCDRFNIDSDNIHVVSKSVGGLISTWLVNNPIANIKSISMFAPVVDFLSMRGRYSDARKAIAKDLAFVGDHVEDFYDINTDGTTETGVPNYYFSPRCQAVWEDNFSKLIRLNPAWNGLVSETAENNYQKSLSDAQAWWSGDYSSDNIYNHPEYNKVGCVPAKIWAAKDDADTPFEVMQEVIEQLKNAGTDAEIYTVNTGGHSCFDVDTTYAEDITTALDILHEDVPLGWIEAIKWIRTNSPKLS